jgi:gluconate 5-dehydrogenase
MNKALLDTNPEPYLEHIPLHRFGGPDDLKGAVVYLASRASDFVTGQVVVVDGGQSAW